jgi:hypothetical protein
VLKGLDPDAHYALTCEDQTSKPTVLTGKDLMKKGLDVLLTETESSELIWIKRE